MLKDFCLADNIDMTSLCEGLQRYQQMFDMEINPYSNLTMTLWNLCAITGVVTEGAGTCTKSILPTSEHDTHVPGPSVRALRLTALFRPKCCSPVPCR